MPVAQERVRAAAAIMSLALAMAHEREQTMDVPPEMIAALENHRNDILAIDGVLGIDIGFTEPGGIPTDDIAIRVLVPDLGNIPADIPSDLDGFPVVVIEREVELDADLARYDPVQGGISVGIRRGILAEGRGTLGGIVLDATTKELRGLSCMHVLCIPPFAAGDEIEQPQPLDTTVNHLGTLLRWSTISPGGPLWQGDDIAFSDAAICTVDRVVGWPTIVDIGPVIHTATAHLKDRVSKRGRTTLLTYGTVNGVYLTTRSSSTGAWLLDQFQVRGDDGTLFCKGGDSGSLVVNDAGEVVGLLWAGHEKTNTGIATHIDDVVADLGISLDWPIPQIDSIAPAEGSSLGGEDVVITGTGFQLASEVRFDGVLVPTFLRQTNSDTEIIANTPPGVGTVEVTVTAPGGTSLATSFTYV